MRTVLVVDDDPLFRRLVVKSLQPGEQITVLEAGGVELAKRVLEQRAAERRDVDVLVTDLQMKDGSGLDLIELLPELSPGTIPILMSGVASPRDYQSALRLGAVDLLIKPFSKEALGQALQRATESATGFRGSFHGLSLVDLLQMIHMARRSLVLEIGGSKHRGILVFEGGELIHAATGGQVGMEALRRFLSAKTGTLTMTPFRKTLRTLSGDLQGMLMDAYREIDEENHQQKPPAEGPELELLPWDGEFEGDEVEETGGGLWELLPSFVGSLDGELGVGLLQGGTLSKLVEGPFSEAEWAELGDHARWLGGELRGHWKQVLWAVGASGLALCQAPGEATSVVLCQRFTSDLDDRRFRWNVSCVSRYLADASAELPS